MTSKRAAGPPPWAYGLASVVVPGLGQLLQGLVQRGLLLLGSVFTALLIFAWRVQELAPRETSWPERLGRAFERRELFVAIVVLSLIALWLWNAWDAYRRREKPQAKGTGVLVFALVLFLALGWQISEIDPLRMIRDLPDAWPPLSRVLWPWEAAITYNTDTLAAGAPVEVPCSQDPPAPPQPEPGAPYLRVEPTCGELSAFDENLKLEPGTTITLEGRNFRPETRTLIWWIDPLGNEFRPRHEGEYMSVTTDEAGGFSVSMVMPYRLVPPSAKGPQLHRVEARQVSEVGGPLPSKPLRLTISRMVETIFMGMMATAFGILFSIPVSFLAARNLMAGSWVTMAIYYITRTVLNIVRSIEPLIWALIAVVWVGLGPFAGIVALTIHSIAALGKLYSEAIEGIDRGPIEAIQATGANRLQTIVYAVIPQMISPFVSFSIYRWDINVRMSTVIGLVGGGGIGFLLVQYIRLLDYRAAGIAVWFIAITVAILDYVSSEIRQRFV
jgi:phosphonate transport system permease protein